MTHPFNIQKKMKTRKFYFFKSHFTDFRLIDLIPIFRKDKNVQGWYFTRTYTCNWFTYCILFDITLFENGDLDRRTAHIINVDKYLK